MNNFKKSILCCLAFVTAFCFVSCSSSTKSADNSMFFPQSENSAKGEATAMDANAAPSLVADQLDRKVIKTASFDVQTKDYDKTITALNEKIASTKSYIEKSNSSGDKASGDAQLSLTVRVPSNEYENFKASITELGNIIFSSEGGEDVTGDYFDKDARLLVLKAQEKRVLELLAKAEDIEDILKIEAELTKIRSEIESLTTVIKRYDDLVSYSTISVNIYQARDYIIKDKTFFDKVADSFKSSIDFGIKLAQNLALVIVWIFPYLLIIGIILVIVLLLIKKSKGKKSSKPPQNPPAPPVQNG